MQQSTGEKGSVVSGEIKLIQLTIDGQSVSVPPGTLIIQAAKKLQKEIPHFCYHPGLSVAGQCRMCFVEIEGAPKLATSCSTPVAEGMKVLTASEKVKAGQSGTLEFILLNHPLDCPICDRGGECKLQDHTYDHGPARSRMIEEKSLKDKHKSVSEGVLLDQERCILCTRCVRFTSEVDGRAELVVNARGSENVIDVFDNRPMTSKFSGNVVDLCPVGALTAKDFRFAARPWEMQKHEGICTGCSMGCNVELNTKHRHPGIARPDHLGPIPQLVRLMPRENLSVNQWWMCDKGRWGYHFHNENEKRITQPMIRRGSTGELSAVSLREIQEHIDQASQTTWSFWIDGTATNDHISWAKELHASWTARGRKLEAINSHPLGSEFLNTWNNLKKFPWATQAANWDSITNVVCSLDIASLEDEIPMLALKLGQNVRRGKMAWHQMSVEQALSKSWNLENTAFLLPVPKTAAAVAELGRLPAGAKFLILWKDFNSRGLLENGICPTEVLEEVFGQSSQAENQNSVFWFGNTTQNKKPQTLISRFKNCGGLKIATDSFFGPVTDAATIVLPLAPLYETAQTATSVEGHGQSAPGIHIFHPNYPEISRGSGPVHASLSLL